MREYKDKLHSGMDIQRVSEGGYLHFTYKDII